MLRLTRACAVAFLALWVVHTEVVAGSAFLGSHFHYLYEASPSAQQAAFGAPYQRETVRLASSLPRNARVLLVLGAADAEGGYAYFWASYWLYPRRVTVATTVTPADAAAASAIVSFHAAGEPAAAPPSGFVLTSSTTYDGTTTAVVYSRGPG